MEDEQDHKIKNSIWINPLPKELYTIGLSDSYLNIIIDSYCKIIQKEIINKRNLLLIYPFLYCTYIPIFAAASFHTLLDKYNGIYPSGVNRVTVISSRPEVHIKLFNTIKRDKTLFQSFVTPGVVRQTKDDYKIERISDFVHPKTRRIYTKGEDCTILFSSFTDILPDRTKVILIDLDSIKLERLEEYYLLKIKELCRETDSVIFVSSLLDEKYVKTINKNFRYDIFGFHPKLIKQFEFTSDSSIPIVLSNCEEIKINLKKLNSTYFEKLLIQPCADQDEATQQLFKCWNEWKKIKDISSINSNTLYKIQNLLNILQGVAVSPIIVSSMEKEMWYLQIKSIEEKLEEIKIKCEKNQLLYTIYLDLERSYQILNNGGGKIAIFEKIIKKFSNARIKILICCFTEQELRATKKFLSQKLSCKEDLLEELYLIHCIHFKDFYKLQKEYKFVILPSLFGGMIHTTLNQIEIAKIIISPLVEKCVALCYPWELRYGKKFITDLERNLENCCINETIITIQKHLHKIDGNIDKNVSELFGMKNQIKVDSLKHEGEKFKLHTDLEESGELLKKVTQWNELVFDVEKIVEEIYTSEFAIPTEKPYPESELNNIPYKTIKFDNGEEIKYPENHVVDVLLEKEVKQKPAKELSKGDKVLLVDANYKKSLNNLILQKLSSTQYDTNIRLTEQWWRRLREYSEKQKHSPADILNLLKLHGGTIQSELTVRGWLKGDVFGPMEGKNIELIGIIYNDEFLQKYWQDIYKSVNKVRSINRRAGHCIARTIRNLSKGVFIDESLEKIDPEIGISSADLADHISILQISNIS